MIRKNIKRSGAISSFGEIKTFGSLLICPTCGSFAELTTRGDAGLNGPPEMSVYTCQDYPLCDSYVGCHHGTQKPLGYLAGSNLRRMRMRAHKAFDWFWKSGQITRTEAYGLLATHLNLSNDEAHIGMLDTEQCQIVVEYFSRRPWKTPQK